MNTRPGRNKNGDEVPRIRLAAILRELLVRGRRTRAELQATFDVTERQMRDDLAALVEHGLVQTVDPGPHRAYELDPSLLVRALPQPDQLAWVVGRQVTRFLAGTELHIEGDEEHPLEQVVRYVAEPSRRLEPKAGFVADLLDAVRSRRRVALTYEAALGPRTYPEFEPTNLLVYKRALYVVGHLGGRPYAYAIDRVKGVVLGDPFPPKPDWNVDAWLGDRFGLTSDPDHDTPEDVILRFAADRRMYILDRTFHPSQLPIEELRDGQVRLTMRVTGKELLPFVLQWGPKVVVESPAWLRDAVIAELRCALSAYAP